MAYNVPIRVQNGGQTMIIILFYCAVIGGLSVALTAIGVSLYDIVQIKHSKQTTKTPCPNITLIVRHHDKNDLQRALTMAEIPYKKLMIIMINATGNSHVARTIQKQRSKKIVVYMSKKPLTAAVINACKKHRRNGPVIALGAHATIDEASLEAAAHYMARSTCDQALLNRYYITHLSIGGLLRSYQQSIEQLVLKTHSMFRAPMTVTAEDTVIYRHARVAQDYATPRNFISDSTAFIEYDAHILHTLSSIVFKKITTWRSIKPTRNTIVVWLRSVIMTLQQLALFAAPVLFGYFVFVALRLHQPVFLLSGMALILMVIVYAVLSDGQLEITDKLRYTLQLPVICLLLPLLFVVPYSALIVVMLKLLTNMAKAKVPRRVGLFVWVKDILRIV
jgi:hypothetical protein